VRLRGGPLGDELGARFGPEVAAKVLAGEVVDQHGAVLDATTVLPAGSSVYLYRDLRDEVPVPFDIPVLYHDDDIVVVDKPHFLATMPLGRHVAQTALVRLRRELGLPELSPAHRLDRLTAGVLSPASGRVPPIRRWALPADPANRAHPPVAVAYGLAWNTNPRRPPVPQRGRRTRRPLLHPAAVVGAAHRIQGSAERGSP
jgi:hypothetical protein